MSSKPLFQFGETVFHAAITGVERQVKCVDCEGSGYVTIIYQGETFTLDCEGCKRGYGSWGMRTVYAHETVVREGVISGVEQDTFDPFAFEYRMSIQPGQAWILKECDTFDTREAAMARAEVLAREARDREEAKINAKHKPDKSWAWNVRYHKSEAERHLKDAEYHKLQLDAARKHAKKEQS